MVPVIDLAPFTTGDEASRRAVAAAVDAACRDVGFFTVVGHGIPAATLDATWTAALAFFELPVEQRMTVAMPYPGYPYGYNPFNVEALNRSIGGDAPPDLKETFNVGPIDPPPRPLEEMEDDDERAVYAPNRWPDEVCPALRPALEAHYRSMAALAARLMEVFAVALESARPVVRAVHRPPRLGVAGRPLPGARSPAAAGPAAGRRPHRLRHADRSWPSTTSQACRCRSPTAPGSTSPTSPAASSSTSAT